VIPKSLFAADRRHHTSRRKGALPASPGGPPSTGQKKLRVLNPILRLYRIQPPGKSFHPPHMTQNGLLIASAIFFF
jgi:hypothetical protein